MVYRTYGVHECWLVDPVHERVTVVNLQARGRRAVARLERGQCMRSAVLPTLDIDAAACFD